MKKRSIGLDDLLLAAKIMLMVKRQMKSTPLGK